MCSVYCSFLLLAEARQTFDHDAVAKQFHPQVRVFLDTRCPGGIPGNPLHRCTGVYPLRGAHDDMSCSQKQSPAARDSPLACS